MQKWQNLDNFSLGVDIVAVDNFSLGDRYVEVYYTILPTLEYIWKFHIETFLKRVNIKERVKESKLKDGSRTGVGAQMNSMYSYTLHINPAPCL